MRTRLRHAGLLGIACALVVLVQGGAIHALLPVNPDVAASAPLCNVPVGSADEPHTATPGRSTPARHHHESRHDHHCILCQSTGAGAIMPAALTPVFIGAAVVSLTTAESFAPPAQQRITAAVPRAPPRA